MKAHLFGLDRRVGGFTFAGRDRDICQHLNAWPDLKDRRSPDEHTSETRRASFCSCYLRDGELGLKALELSARGKEASVTMQQCISLYPNGYAFTQCDDTSGKTYLAPEEVPVHRTVKSPNQFLPSGF